MERTVRPDDPAGFFQRQARRSEEDQAPVAGQDSAGLDVVLAGHPLDSRSGGVTRPASNTLIANGLVDELHLLMYPLALGKGKRVLPDGVHAAFRLLSARPYPTGVVGLHYARQA